MGKELWNEIPEKSLQEDEVNGILSRKSSSEVDRFKKLLQIELYLSWGLVIVVFFLQGRIANEITALIYVMVLLGSLLNIITLWQLRKLQLLDDVRSFLENALKALQAFVTGFILTSQIIILSVIIAFKFLKHNHLSWYEWLSSEQGTSIIAVFFIIEVILLWYAWQFYIKRIYALKKMLKEMDF